MPPDASIHVLKEARQVKRPKHGRASALAHSDEAWDVKAHLDLVLDSLTDHAILTLDIAGHVTTWNRAARETKGYDAADIIGRHFSVFYTEADRQAGMPMRLLRLASDLGRHECEGWRVRKDGGLFWAAIVIHPLRDKSGKLRGFVKITRDLSERRQFEKLREELYQSHRLETVGKLTACVAHDFNNLLTTIEAGHDLLQEYTQDERVHNVLDISRHATAQSKKLITQLLAFSRRQLLNPEASNLHSLITGMDSLLQHAAGPHIRFRWNLAPGLPPVLIDQAQFQAVLLNLVVNAREAMPAGGWLTVFMDTQTLSEAAYAPPYDIPAGEYLVVGVCDTGTGMEQAVVDRAIEPFFTTKLPGKGSGLGLSQCYGFVRQSGGTLKIDTSPGRGTTVRLLLPAHAAVGTAQKNFRRILFVDDDVGIRTLVSEVLRVSGHTVIEADDGRSALKLLQADDTIDCLLTDIVMPNDMNGVELMHAARAARPGLPTVLASGYPREALRDLGKIPDDVSFVVKPYSLYELNAHLAGAR